MKIFFCILSLIFLTSCVSHFTLMEVQYGEKCYHMRVNPLTGKYEKVEVPCYKTSFGKQ